MTWLSGLGAGQFSFSTAAQRWRLLWMGEQLADAGGSGRLKQSRAVSGVFGGGVVVLLVLLSVMLRHLLTEGRRMDRPAGDLAAGCSLIWPLISEFRPLGKPRAVCWLCDSISKSSMYSSSMEDSMEHVEDRLLKMRKLRAGV